MVPFRRFFGVTEKFLSGLHGKGKRLCNALSSEPCGVNAVGAHLKNCEVLDQLEKQQAFNDLHGALVHARARRCSDALR